MYRLGAHTAVIDWKFYTGKQFPEKYQGGRIPRVARFMEPLTAGGTVGCLCARSRMANLLVQWSSFSRAGCSIRVSGKCGAVPPAYSS